MQRYAEIMKGEKTGYSSLFLFNVNKGSSTIYLLPEPPQEEHLPLLDVQLGQSRVLVEP